MVNVLVDKNALFEQIPEEGGSGDAEAGLEFGNAEEGTRFPPSYP